MREPPAYFNEIQQRAEARWNQLEADPELAAPWRLLFTQVQSPRHVLSELLQNADDAGATIASSHIEDGCLVFSHNGEDFTEEQFASLCRFGFSNKRTLHTIGFRGIGFKATFSLGATVDVLTPSLSVRFHKNRFTQPVWIPGSPPENLTCVRVPLEDAHRTAELRKNLDDWKQSPSSLLFFRCIKRLTIDGSSVEKRRLSPGPSGDSERLELDCGGTESSPVILFRSAAEPFPPDAIEEIRQERNTADLNLPPCCVEIVLGLPGEQRLYVVLPTGLALGLPFSANAPFLQDPARFAIKDPAISPTNRWLLRRVGALAGKAMLEWLRTAELPMAERAEAYMLLPTPPTEDSGLETACGNLVAEAFAEATADAEILLTSEGDLVPASQCIAPPRDLYAIWRPDELLTICGAASRRLLSNEIPETSRDVLDSWRWISTISEENVLDSLRACRVPQPGDADRLVRLWAFVQRHVRYDYGGTTRRKLRIVPVKGQTLLDCADNVVRLPGRRALSNEEDWEFLTAFTAVVEPSWLEFLMAEHAGGEYGGRLNERDRASARELLEPLGLDGATAWEKIFSHASHRLLDQATVPVEQLVRLTHVMAQLNVQAPADFEYVTRDCTRRGRSHDIIFDPAGRIESQVPVEWAPRHFLHAAYHQLSGGCSQEAWSAWAASEKSGLLSSVPFAPTSVTFEWKGPLRQFLSARGCREPEKYPYRGDKFRVDDLDFPDKLLTHWQSLARKDSSIWRQVLAVILDDPQRLWAKRIQADARQCSGSYTKPLSCGVIPANWIMRFRQLPCLVDTYGVPHQPAELLMRTPDTEPLLGVDRFVRAEDDREATKPLLRMLGVRDTPSGPERLIDRIRALATVETPPVHEVAKWYDALDRVLCRCRPEDLAKARGAFSAASLILAEDLTWCRLGEVYLEPTDHEFADTPLVHSSVRGLSMWRRIGVPETPSVGLIIDSLKRLPSGQKPDSQALPRLRGFLKRYAHQVWDECQHWLSLEGTWVPTSGLNYRVSMQSLAKYTDLFPTFKARTVDFRMLSADTCDEPPFSTLTNLGAAIDYRIRDRQSDLPEPVEKPWLRALGDALQRVILDDQSQTDVVRQVATRLSNTAWQPFKLLRVVPYVENTPAGEPLALDVLWDSTTLYVREIPLSRTFNAVVVELSRPFGLSSIAEAIKACAERDAAFVTEYLEENFKLDAGVLVADESEELGGSPEEGDDSGDSWSVEQERRDGTAEPQAPEPVGAIPIGESGSDSQADTALPEPRGPGPRRTAHERQLRQTTDATLIARYAAAKGYHWDPADNRFIHPDGSSFRKSESGGFNWQRHSANGMVMSRLWVSEQSLSNNGIEIAADLWEMIKRAPALSVVVLEGDDGRAEEYRGLQLLKMVNEAQLRLYPAKYRIRRNTDT